MQHRRKLLADAQAGSRDRRYSPRANRQFYKLYRHIKKCSRFSAKYKYWVDPKGLKEVGTEGAWALALADIKAGKFSGMLNYTTPQTQPTTWHTP